MNIIWANTTKPNFRILDLYKLFETRQKPILLYIKKDKIIDPLYVDCKTINAQIENSIVFILDLDPSLFKLGKNNKLIYFADRELSANDIKYLPIIDTIIVYSYYESNIIVRQLRRLGYNTPVAKYYPPFNIRTYKNNTNKSTGRIGCAPGTDATLIGLDGNFIVNLYPNIWYYLSVDAYIRLNNDGWPYDIMEAMFCGRPVIAQNNPPFSEYIINNYNGLLVRTRDDLKQAITQIPNIHKLGQNGRAIIETIYDPIVYIIGLINITNDNFFNLNKLGPLEHLQKPEKIWIIKKEILESGSLTYSPSDYNHQYDILNISSLLELLEFALEQDFAHIYVFDIGLEDTSIQDLNAISTLIPKLNKKSKNIHFCFNPPEQLYNIFKHFSITSEEEGLKQVR